MNQQEFNRRAKEALKAKADGRPEEAAEQLRAILRDLVPAVKEGVNDWHHQQALALLVDTLQAAGRNEECRSAWKELIELTEQTAVYWEKALASTRNDFEQWSIEHR
jgi:hypothetical protein